jgi:hypothetical protein
MDVTQASVDYIFHARIHVGILGRHKRSTGLERTLVPINLLILFAVRFSLLCSLFHLIPEKRSLKGSINKKMVTLIWRFCAQQQQNLMTFDEW